MRHKLDFERVKEYEFTEDNLAPLQVAVFVMCGGGMVGRMAAEQPADFYIDSRVGALAYGKKDIYQAVEVLKVGAVKAGLNPHHLPRLPLFHNCGIF